MYSDSLLNTSRKRSFSEGPAHIRCRADLRNCICRWFERGFEAQKSSREGLLSDIRLITYFSGNRMKYLDHGFFGFVSRGGVRGGGFSRGSTFGVSPFGGGFF
jgi:hypothetical protein